MNGAEAFAVEDEIVALFIAIHVQDVGFAGTEGISL